jgi:FAD/FMN-containing dehydrogenase
MSKYNSFGRYPKPNNQEIHHIKWRYDLPDLNSFSKNILPYGLGKSYGDSCLNEDGILIDIRGLNKFISWDEEEQTLETEAGLTLAECLDFLVPRGYFLKSTPGTKHITVGGAIANDVHGKNHHKGGTFGCHVKEFQLYRSDMGLLKCSPDENEELFKATIGGLGLTGIIISAKFEVEKIPSPYLKVDSIKYANLEEFFQINKESEKDFEYTVSWTDCTASGGDMGRGLYTRGNFTEVDDKLMENLPKDKMLPFPFDFPFINSLSVSAFNSLYFNKQLNGFESFVSHYNPFFYPLDAVDGWNKAYGKDGFLQYQFVIPLEKDNYILKHILKYIVNSGLSSFLTVLKTFGNIKSPGMLSFPRPGVTMAIDFRMRGDILDVLEYTDRIVEEAGGVIYPAKDARMSAEHFQKFYPQWEEFTKFIDPKFSSSFWRRVTKGR